MTRPALTLALAILLSSLPALAQQDRPVHTPDEQDRLIAECIEELGEDKARACEEMIGGGDAVARRALRRWPQWKLDAFRRCLEDPAVLNPETCARAVDPLGR